jgi:transmembrane sensor
MDELVAAARAQQNVTVLHTPIGRSPTADIVHARAIERLHGSRRWRGLAAAVALVAVAAVLVLWPNLRGTQRYATSRGEQRSVVLADGSVVQLNALSRISVRFDGHTRRIELTDGEAYFRVARDKQRPFEVVTTLATVRAVGTEFNVYSRDRSVRVAVMEGRVQVSPRPRTGGAVPGSAAESAAIAGKPSPDPVLLGARNALEIDTIGRLSRADLEQPEQAIAWMQRRLVFEDEPLAEVVEEFNRYNRQQLQIADRELAALRISGVFDADDSDILVQYLERAQHVKVQVEGQVIQLARKSRDGVR